MSPLIKRPFLNGLDELYQYHNASSNKKLLKLFVRLTQKGRLEKALRDKVSIDSNYIENKWWVNIK